MIAPGNGGRESPEQRLERCRPGFHRGLVDDQTRRHLADLLDFDQLIGTQGVAGGNQIDDGVGKTDQRCELHRSVQLDQLDVDPLAGEVLTGDCSELGRDPQARPTTDGLLVIKTHPRRNAHPATANAQVNRLVQRVVTSLREVLIVSDPFHLLRCRLIAEEVGLVAYTSPTPYSVVTGGTAVKKEIEEAAGVAAGRIIGFRRLLAITG